MSVEQDLHKLQSDRFLNPHGFIQEDMEAIYIKEKIVIGWPEGASRIFEGLSRKNTVAFIGTGLGDEGKGRVVDNKVAALLSIPGIKQVYVVRFQGGNNAGHTLEKDGLRFALHQVPSGVMYEEVVGVMDSGMVIHPEDLQTEVGYVEDIVGDTRGKLILSESAILCTDLERAEESLNRVLEGKAKGGTGRGISPAYAHHYDRLGLKIFDLLSEDWRKKLGDQYDRYGKIFEAFGLDLKDTLVPDFRAEKATGSVQVRKVGTKEEFLDRLETARTWLVGRDMVKNTFLIHRDIFTDLSAGVLFEGAQAVGLHPWLGTRPDVTSSDTSVNGITTSTGLWRTQEIADRVGVFKITYTSSVGARHMPTHVDLPRDLADLPTDASDDQKWAAFVREEAHEYGSTTRRPRDILHLDLPLMVYNAHVGGVEVLAGTHLDIAREGEPVKVCTHYTDKDGNYIPYQPGLQYLEGVIPYYVELPGWDGKAAQKAKSLEELPENALKFLAFVQRRTFPIVFVTNGAARDNFIEFPGCHYYG